VLPENRLKEVREFVSSGARDFSISRLKSKMSWGIPVPGDPDHVMYVWFDALVNYISTLGWPEDKEKFTSFWPGTQIAGKDNLRQQAAMWQAMLMSANLPNSRQILIHGFITSGGAKMSKTVGNVVDPLDIISKYGSEALRFWLAKEVPVFEDGDFTWHKLHEAYTSGLSNGLGNLVSRVLKMASDQNVRLSGAADPKEIRRREFLPNDYVKALSSSDIRSGIEMIWQIISDCDTYIQKEEPFRKVKVDPEGAKKDLTYLLGRLLKISIMLEPYMPDTALRILHALSDGKAMEHPLFPRVEAPVIAQ
jgi:methionyl-tRNA synthetase